MSEIFFFLNEPTTTEFYALPSHDALQICHDTPGDVMGFAERHFQRAHEPVRQIGRRRITRARRRFHARGIGRDRKSTRLNSSHSQISYAVFCLKLETNSSMLTCCQYLCCF